MATICICCPKEQRYLQPDGRFGLSCKTSTISIDFQEARQCSLRTRRRKKRYTVCTRFAFCFLVFLCSLAFLDSPTHPTLDKLTAYTKLTQGQLDMARFLLRTKYERGPCRASRSHHRIVTNTRTFRTRTPHCPTTRIVLTTNMNNDHHPDQLSTKGDRKQTIPFQQGKGGKNERTHESYLCFSLLPCDSEHTPTSWKASRWRTSRIVQHKRVPPIPPVFPPSPLPAFLPRPPQPVF